MINMRFLCLIYIHINADMVDLATFVLVESNRPINFLTIICIKMLFYCILKFLFVTNLRSSLVLYLVEG